MPPSSSLPGSNTSPSPFPSPPPFSSLKALLQPALLPLLQPFLSHIETLYHPTLCRVYHDQITNKVQTQKKEKTSNADEVVARKLDLDRWRYQELVQTVVGRRRKRRKGKKGEGKDEMMVMGQGNGDGKIGAYLEKEELERLVEWKITHGTHRPFLLPLIRKNPPELVRSATESAFASLSLYPSGSPSQRQEHLQKALSLLTKALKGVGPATASLILSVTHPENILFFSDELYGWLVAGKHTGEGGGAEDYDDDDNLASQKKNKARATKPTSTKLKYDAKEYRQLMDAWLEFKSTTDQGTERVTGSQMEKAAWVFDHWHLVDAEGRRKATGILRGEVKQQEEAEGERNPEGENSHPIASSEPESKPEPESQRRENTLPLPTIEQDHNHDDDEDDGYDTTNNNNNTPSHKVHQTIRTQRPSSSTPPPLALSPSPSLPREKRRRGTKDDNNDTINTTATATTTVTAKAKAPTKNDNDSTARRSKRLKS